MFLRIEHKDYDLEDFVTVVNVDRIIALRSWVKHDGKFCVVINMDDAFMVRLYHATQEECQATAKTLFETIHQISLRG